MDKETSMKKHLYVLVAMSVSLIGSGISFADDSANANAPESHHHHHHHRHGFMMGVCVGQNLAQQGVTLPAPTPGVKPTPDAATKAAFEKAIAACKAQFPHHASPSGTPSAE